MQYFESRLADLHQGASLAVHDVESRSKLSDPNNSGQESNDFATYRVVVSAAKLAFASSSTSSVLHRSLGIHYEAKLFYPSERPPLKIPVNGIYNEKSPRTASRGAAFRLPDLPATVARSIPLHVARKLFSNYLKSILPTNPCFLDDDLVHQFDCFYLEGHDREEIPESTCFIVSMVMAISCLTSKSHDFWKVASLSESLQRDALRHSAFLARADFRSLQCIILLIQMALLLPYTANLWYLSGESMRIAISLGLNQEHSGPSELDARIANLRRSVFWSIYQLERTIAIASGCPLAISDEHISIQLPFDNHSSHSEVEETRGQREDLFRSNVQLSRLQSEIHGIQFFDQSLPLHVPDHGDWVLQVEKSVADWHESLNPGDITGWLSNAADHCRLLLYRPCSRNIVLSDSGLQAATSASICTIHGCWALVQRNALIHSFQCVYNAFQAGMVLLYALGNHGPIELGFALEEAANEAILLLVPLLVSLTRLEEPTWSSKI